MGNSKAGKKDVKSKGIPYLKTLSTVALKKHAFGDEKNPAALREKEKAAHGLFIAKVASYREKPGVDGKKASLAFACTSAQLVVEGGEVIAESNTLYLPGPGELRLRGLLDEAGSGVDPETGDKFEDGSVVDVAFEVFTVPMPDVQAGYVWECVDRIDRSGFDALAELRNSIDF